MILLNFYCGILHVWGMGIYLSFMDLLTLLWPLKCSVSGVSIFLSYMVLLIVVVNETPSAGTSLPRLGDLSNITLK